jgi:ribonuclease P/MRP protein subunit RPP1
MKRSFSDLHANPNLQELDATIKFIKKAKNLDYAQIGFSVDILSDSHSTDTIQNFCKEKHIDFVSRIDLSPRNRNELKSQLRKVRRKYEIICVKCKTKEVARQAAQDRRVDLLNFPSLYFRNRFFDRNEAELASNSLTALEIEAKPLLILEGSSRTRLLSFLRRETTIANDFHIPIVLSSGATETTLLRKPRELATLLHLLDFDENSALDTVSTNPNMIVSRNRDKLSSSFVAPGIKIIQEGDC